MRDRDSIGWSSFQPSVACLGFVATIGTVCILPWLGGSICTQNAIPLTPTAARPAAQYVARPGIHKLPENGGPFALQALPVSGTQGGAHGNAGGILVGSARTPPGNPSPLAAARDVRKEGAIGDGQHDDTEALQASLMRGGVILFSPGTYRITKTLEVNLAATGWISLHGLGTARLVMAGPGPAIRFVGSHTGSADPQSVQPGVWSHERAPLVDSLEIVGQHPEACGIEALRTMQLTITRTVIRETLHAVRLHQRARNVLISSCHLYNNRGVGLFLDDVDLHQINVVGCHISYNGGGGIVVKKGYLRNLQVSGCDIEANMAREGEPTANILIDSRESQVGHAEIAIVGCTIQHSVKAPQSANIRFYGGDTKGRSWGNLTITANVLSDVVRNVELVAARGVAIVGNTFWGAAEEDLRLVNCQNVAIGPNSFDQNPNYAAEGNYCGGVTLRQCDNCSLNGLQLAAIRATQAAVLIEDSRGVNITGCVLTDCQPVGVLLDRVTSSRISDCLIRADRGLPSSAGNGNQASREAVTAIRVIQASGILVCNNLVEGMVELPGEGVTAHGNVRPSGQEKADPAASTQPPRPAS